MANNIVGHIDHLGYLYCSDCVVVPPEATPGGRDACLVREGDTHANERCDDCGQILTDVLIPEDDKCRSCNYWIPVTYADKIHNMEGLGYAGCCANPTNYNCRTIWRDNDQGSCDRHIFKKD